MKLTKEQLKEMLTLEQFPLSAKYDPQWMQENQMGPNALWLKIFGDPKVMASFGGATFNREQMERWMQRNIEHQNLHDYGNFSVILKSEGLLIGDCGLEHMEVDGVEAVELGYDFRSDYWNQGFATEAAIAVRDYAFNVLHLPRLISLIRVGNAASKRVSEKIGMRFVAEITRHGISYRKYAIDGSAMEIYGQGVSNYAN